MAIVGRYITILFVDENGVEREIPATEFRMSDFAIDMSTTDATKFYFPDIEIKGNINKNYFKTILKWMYESIFGLN